jgi:flagellar basal-body rod modification protein FlgD
MSDLILPVKEGKVQQTNTESTSTPKKNDLDKNAFLQLLTTQMKYQDPLNPNTDTEYIAQLATFSQLEQLQNLSAVTTNTQAFNLVGKDVIIKTESDSKKTTYVSGRVDFVNMNGSKTQLSVNGNLYNIDQLDTVIADEYIAEQNLPGVTQATALKYDAANPKDLTIEVKLGSGDTVADNIAIVINEGVIDASLLKLSGNKVTIKKEAFAELENGTYKVIVAFNDPLLTTVKDKVTLQVLNAVPEDNGDGDTPDDGDAEDGQ